MSERRPFYCPAESKLLLLQEPVSGKKKCKKGPDLLDLEVQEPCSIGKMQRFDWERGKQGDAFSKYGEGD